MIKLIVHFILGNNKLFQTEESEPKVEPEEQPTIFNLHSLRLAYNGGVTYVSVGVTVKEESRLGSWHPSPNSKFPLAADNIFKLVMNGQCKSKRI